MTITDRKSGSASASVASARLGGIPEGIGVKAPVRAATTANITLNGLQTVDGVSLAAGDRVLVKDQTSGVDNGIYDAGSGNWTRSVDFVTNGDVVDGTRVWVGGDGTTNHDQEFVVTSSNDIDIGTDAITFENASDAVLASSIASQAQAVAGTNNTKLMTPLRVQQKLDDLDVTAGAGLTGTGTLGADLTLAVGAGTGITVNANDVALTVPVSVANGGVGGGWTNTRLAKTANYTVANADKGSTIALGGAAYYTLTFSAASGYDANFMVWVLNEDTARWKLLAINGLTSFRLAPGQMVPVANQNNVWKTNGPYRWLLSASQNIYVDPSSGTDSTAVDGMASGAAAFATLDYAYKQVQKYWDLGGASTVTCNLPSGTIAVTAGTTFIGPLVGAQFPNAAVAAFGAPFIIAGAGIASTNYTSSTASVDLFSATAGAAIQVQALSINITGANSHGLQAAGAGFVAFQTIDFKAGNTSSGAHLNAAGNSSVIQSIGAYTVSGSINIHGVSENMSTIVLNQVATITGTPAWSTAFVQADLGGMIEGTGFTFSGAGSTGKRCQAVSLGKINTSGGSLNSFFPGNAIGTADAASFAYFQ